MTKQPISQKSATPAGSVTVSQSPEQELLSRIMNFVLRYVSFSDDYALPIALWTICTYIFPSFDAFPYMVITSDTKRSGKTRLGEIISFMCSNPRSFGAMTPSAMFRVIDEVQPTIFFDEAEILSQESAGTMRSVLNMGYRKGSTVPRTIGNEVVEFKTYCPKVFILIGDVLDTLKDRSIIVRMKRSEAPSRFVYEPAKAEGEEIRDAIAEMLSAKRYEIEQKFTEFSGIEFLTDRDEEIWSPIFVLASVLCPERVKELSRIAVDMATEKTAEKKRYTDLMKQEAEENAQKVEYSIKLLRDMHIVMKGKNISSQEAVEALRSLPLSPWRKFRGDGITMHNVADTLAKYGIKTAPFRRGKQVLRGYKWEQVDKLYRQNNLHTLPE